jgi:hypothetical protein
MSGQSLTEAFAPVEARYQREDKMKTHWTLAEAKAEAFQEFPVTLSSYDVHDFARGKSELADLLHALVTGGEAWVQPDPAVEAYTVMKPTRKYVERRFHNELVGRQTEIVLKRWCAVHRIQRYEIDGQVKFELWDKNFQRCKPGAKDRPIQIL